MKKIICSWIPFLMCAYFSPAWAQDFGDAPDSYWTKADSGGPQHAVDGALYLGVSIPDADINGQPDVNALGDDQDGGDDEDALDGQSLVFFESTTPQITVRVFNNKGVDAKLAVWLDVNSDGAFKSDGTEYTTVNVVSKPNPQDVVVTLPSIPAGAANGLAGGQLSYLRLRLSTNDTSLQTPGGASPDGEVEDWRVDFFENWDAGDLPDTGALTGTGDYQTTVNNTGPRHKLGRDVYLGAGVDADSAPQPLADAGGDDSDGNDDEDGVTVPPLIPGETATFTVAVTNQTTDKAAVWGYVDWNGDGDFGDSFEAKSAVVNSGTVGNVTLDFTVPSTVTRGRSVGARFRIATDFTFVNNGNAYGDLSDGEVEDEWVYIEELDFGDLPDTTAGTGPGDYQTLLANDGPRHVITSDLYLLKVPDDGNPHVDNEADGVPGLSATGDDTSGEPDEDGGLVAVEINDEQLQLVIANTATNQLPDAATFYVFIDANSDGDFSDAGEAHTWPVPAGSTAEGVGGLVAFPLENYGPGEHQMYIRHRLSTDNILGPDGFAPDGEVEDYLETFTLNQAGQSTGSLPDLGPGTGALDYETDLENGGPGHFSGDLYFGAAAPADVTEPSGDGISLPEVFARGESVSVEVTATNTFGSLGWIYGFIDWNRDGDFEDTGEQTTPVAIADGTEDGIFSLAFTVPADAEENLSLGARFRISNQADLGPNGPGGFGEVEDFLILVKRLDFGDLPDTGPGTGSGNYQTLQSDNGPRHALGSDLYFSLSDVPGFPNVDAEADGNPGTEADGDDTTGIDDEPGTHETSYPSWNNDLWDEGVVAFTVDITETIPVTNQTGSIAILWRGFDRNRDGDFDDPGEVQTVGVPSGTVNQEISTTWTLTQDDIYRPVRNDYHTRARLSLNVGMGATGLEAEGEVVDTLLESELPTVLSRHIYSQGTLPDLTAGTGPGDYQTDLDNDGPLHWRNNHLRLGNSNVVGGVDPEAENGISVPEFDLRRGRDVTFNVRATNTTGEPGWVVFFVDWNGDGDFEDNDEAAQQAIADGETDAELSFSFQVPETAPLSTDLGVRIRISNVENMGPTGHVPYGEVHDQLVQIQPTSEDYYDLWAIEQGLSPANDGVDLNPDSGDRANLEEYEFGGDPLVEDGPAAEIRLELVEDQGQTYAEVVFPARKDRATRDMTYNVFLGEHLPFREFHALILQENPVSLNDDYEELRYRSTREVSTVNKLFAVVDVTYGNATWEIEELAVQTLFDTFGDLSLELDLQRKPVAAFTYGMSGGENVRPFIATREANGTWSESLLTDPSNTLSGNSLSGIFDFNVHPDNGLSAWIFMETQENNTVISAEGTPVIRLQLGDTGKAASLTWRDENSVFGISQFNQPPELQIIFTSNTGANGGPVLAPANPGDVFHTSVGKTHSGHLAFSYSKGDQLTYGEWAPFEALTQQPVNGTAGADYPSLWITSDGTPAVVFTMNGELWLAEQAVPDWTLEHVWPSASSAYPDMKEWVAGTKVISSISAEADLLFHVEQGNGWVEEQIIEGVFFGPGARGTRTSLEISSKGEPMILFIYSDGVQRSLRLAIRRHGAQRPE